MCVCVFGELTMDFSDVVKALKTPPVSGWNRKLIWRGALSSAVGMCLGMVTSLILNVALVEISISPFFAMYFGVLFTITGGVIAWRILGTPLPDENARSRQKTFLALAVLVSRSCILGKVRRDFIPVGFDLWIDLLHDTKTLVLPHTSNYQGADLHVAWHIDLIRHHLLRNRPHQFWGWIMSDHF